jgi:NADH-quinone oxidoreductase subunit A
MIFEHLTIISAVLFSAIIALALFGVVYLLVKVSGLGLHIEKLAAYECGFYPFEDTRQMFRIRYYLIAILFIIFDLEIILLIPLVAFYPDMFFLLNNDFFNYYYQEFFVVVIFLVIITLGFAYE